MNERTKELAEQAGFVLWPDRGPFGEVIDWASSYDMELGKFAELVREDEMNERELAIQSGLNAPYGSDREGLRDFDYRKFAELIRADEREACAKIVEADGKARGTTDTGVVLLKNAERIRARGEK